MRHLGTRLSAAYLATLALVAVFSSCLASEAPLVARTDAGWFLLPGLTNPPEYVSGEETFTLMAPVPFGPNQQDKGYAPLLPPSPRHWLGTDHARRDVLARLIFGTRVALFGSLWAVGLALVLGVGLGLCAGYLGGVVDAFISRATEAILAVPAFFLVLALLGVLTAPSLATLLTAIGLVSWPRIARITRAETLRLRDAHFIEAARLLGYGRARIFACHLVPNLAPPVLTAAVLALLSVVLTEASLSFLGFGAPETTPTWGGLLQGAMGHMEAWWLVAPPGVLLVATTLAYNRLAEALR